MNNEELGEESSSSDSSEESSSEEDNQQQQGDKEDSSSSSESDGGESATEENVEVRVQGHQPEIEASQFPSTQDLFGGDSSSESSSESEDETKGNKSSKGVSSPTESGTPEPPEISPIGGDDSPIGGDDSPVGSPGGEGEEEEEGTRKEVQTVEGIFGDAADLSSSDEETSPTHENRRRAAFGDVSDDDDIPPMMEDGEPVEVEEEAPRINVDIPRCVAEIGSEPFFVKLPNFLSVDTRPFDSELYEDEVEDDDLLDDEGRARLKLKVENTIRWRYSQDEDGNGVRESNARVVRWTDGSMSLYLGGEIFDITRQPLQGEFSHLFVRQGTGLQGQAVFRNKLTFRPHSTDSQTHRKMTLSIADRFSKAQKIRVLPAVGRDPESQRNERIKKEEENLRSTVRQEQHMRRAMERKKKKLTASFLEPDRNVDPEEDITAIKSSVRSRVGRPGRGGRGRGGGYSDEDSSEEEDEEEDEAHKRLMRAKDNEGNSPPGSVTKRQIRGSSAKGAGGGGSAKKVTKSRKLVFSSDEDSD